MMNKANADTGTLYIISAPSGAGKSSLLRVLLCFESSAQHVLQCAIGKRENEFSIVTVFGAPCFGP